MMLEAEREAHEYASKAYAHLNRPLPRHLARALHLAISARYSNKRFIPAKDEQMWQAVKKHFKAFPEGAFRDTTAPIPNYLVYGVPMTPPLAGSTL